MLLEMWNIAQMLPKVRKNAKGCSKCKIVLQTRESVQKVLSAIWKGLAASPPSPPAPWLELYYDFLLNNELYYDFFVVVTYPMSSTLLRILAVL